MTGIRQVIGMGRLNRVGGEKLSEMPYKYTKGKTDNKWAKDEAGTRVTPLEVISGTANDSTGGIVSLIHRFGSGVDITIEKEREINYHRDLGFREYTLASPGMYNISFTVSGYFSPRDFAEWGESLFMNTAIELEATTLVYTSKSTLKGGDGVALSAYVETITTDDLKAGSGFIAGSKGSRLEVPNELLLKYHNDITKNNFRVRLIYPELLNNPTDYAIDIATLKLNAHTPKGGADEAGVLCGCMFDSGSFTYEAGGDMGLKFSLEGFALRDYKNVMERGTSSAYLTYRDEIDEVDPDIYITGCLSVKKTDKDTFEEVAYTDSASFKINNNIQKLPDCGQLVYSGGIMGQLEIDQELKTYSNQPDRYLPAVYGVEFERDEETGAYVETTTYSVAKLPKPLDAILIRSTDSKYTGDDVTTDYTKFIDMVTRKVYVSQVNNSYSVEEKIMDEPTVKPFFGWIGYGFKKTESNP